MLCSKLWTVCLRNMDRVCLVKHENTTPVQCKHSSSRTWGLLCRFQVFRTHSTFMLKWISVLFSHCIKWTRVLVPLPLQHSGNVVLVKAQTVALCWRLGLPRRDQDEELQPSLSVLAQQLNADQSECVRTMGQSRALPELLQQLHCCSLSLPGAAAQGCRVSEPSPGRLSDCTIFSYRLCWDPRVAGEGLLWLNAAWIYMCNILYLSFVCVDLHHCFYWF